MRQQTILCVSDGSNQPPLTQTARAEALSRAAAFKNSGGIIICVGIKASGDGFTLLQGLATDGYFLNVFDHAGALAAANEVKALLGYFCGGGSSPEPLGPQVPDPWPAADPESPELPGDPPAPLPQLPPVNFDPSSGSVGSGLDVALSVPGHPDAWIRFTVGTPPRDPNFAYPPEALTGLDYEGLEAPVALVGAATIKAIARKTGYADSEVASAAYSA